jgi:hypothetical protein
MALNLALAAQHERLRLARAAGPGLVLGWALQKFSGHIIHGDMSAQ